MSTKHLTHCCLLPIAYCLARSAIIWVLILILGFPLLVILLGELSHRLQDRGKPWVPTLGALRNLILPVLAFLLFVRYVLGLAANHHLVRSIETLFWLCIIHGALSLLNTIVFAQAGEHSWRARVPKLLIDLSRLLLVLLGAAIVLATVWRADLAGLVTALGISSLVIGLALQDTIGSVVSGIALLFERPFAVGDWLRVGDIIGQVIDIIAMSSQLFTDSHLVEMHRNLVNKAFNPLLPVAYCLLPSAQRYNWRAVRLKTLEQEMVVIPHRLIGSDIIRNFSRPQRLHAERVRISFSYNDPPNLAKQVLRITALETQGILINPAPQIFTISYDDFAITYEVKFFIEDYADLENIRDRFVTRIWYAAQRNHLNIPFPIHTLYHFDGPKAQAESTEKKLTDSWQSLHNLVPLDQPENLAHLSQDTILLHFGAGEQVFKQGNFNTDLFVIISGQGIMTTVDNKGQEYEILPLMAGEFFGAMTLFSNEPSPVSIRAVSDLEVMRLSQDVVNQMLQRQSSFVRELGQVIQSHRKAIEEFRQTFSDSTQSKPF